MTARLAEELLASHGRRCRPRRATSVGYSQPRPRQVWRRGGAPMHVTQAATAAFLKILGPERSKGESAVVRTRSSDKEAFSSPRPKPGNSSLMHMRLSWCRFSSRSPATRSGLRHCLPVAAYCKKSVVFLN